MKINDTKNNYFFDFYENLNNKFIKKSATNELEIFSNTNNNLNGIQNKLLLPEQIPFYSCTQHTNLDYYIEKKLNSLSSDEFKIFKKIVIEVKDLTAKFGNAQVPKSSLCGAFYQLRIINKFFPASKKIFELGPGSGYLSLLLALDDKVIFNTDVTHAYYIYQYELFNHFGIINELSFDSVDFIYKEGKINHIPWWIYSSLEKNQIDIDLVVFNNGICELPESSFDYFLYFLKMIDNPDVLLIGSGQEKYFYTHYEVIKKFSYNGYQLDKKSCNNENEIYILKYDERKKNNDFFKSPILQRRFDWVKQMFFFYNNNKIIFKKGDVDIKKIKEFYKEVNITNKSELLEKKLSKIYQI